MRAALTLLMFLFAQQGTGQLPPPGLPPRSNTSQPPAASEPGRLPIHGPLPAIGEAPARPAAAGDGLVKFDHHAAEVRWRNNRWEMVAGNVWLKDFGQREHDAREALRIVKALRLTHRGAIGSPAPVMEYWLSEGAAPTAFGSGLRLTPIDLQSLRVEQVNNMWCVRDDQQLLFNFGVQKPFAEQAVEVIRRHGFTKVGYVGYPRPTMIYFVGGGQGLSPTSLRQPGIQVPRIPRADLPKEANRKDLQPDDPRKAEREALAAYHAQQMARGVRQLSPPLTATTASIHFDPRQVALRADRNHWKLYFGHVELADFGADAQRARQVLQLLQDYRCDQQCLIGQPTPSFAYFLAHGRAPRGVSSALKGFSFRPEKVQVQQTGNGWCVSEGGRMLASLSSRDDAQELLKAIQRHQFDYAAPLGGNLTFLARSR